MNARLRLLLLYITLFLAFIGGLVFVIGLLVELFSSREALVEGTSPDHAVCSRWFVSGRDHVCRLVFPGGLDAGAPVA